MTTWDLIRFIVEILAVIIGGGWLIRLLTVKSHVRQEQAEAAKTVEEAKQMQTDNIKKIVDDIYLPRINDLKDMVNDLRDAVKQVQGENESLKKEVDELKEENGRLKKENEELRDALREIRPDVVPSRRSINAQNQNRNEKGQFAKVEE